MQPGTTLTSVMLREKYFYMRKRPPPVALLTPARPSATALDANERAQQPRGGGPAVTPTKLSTTIERWLDKIKVGVSTWHWLVEGGRWGQQRTPHQHSRFTVAFAEGGYEDVSDIVYDLDHLPRTKLEAMLENAGAKPVHVRRIAAGW